MKSSAVYHGIPACLHRDEPGLESEVRTGLKSGDGWQNIITSIDTGNPGNDKILVTH